MEYSEKANWRKRQTQTKKILHKIENITVISNKKTVR